ANVSLNCRPPITRGTTTYQADTAVKYQTFTNVWPKLQNKVRLKSTFTVSVQPNAQGINVNTSIVTPIVPTNSNRKIPVAKKENCCAEKEQYNMLSSILFPPFGYIDIYTPRSRPNS